MFIANLAASKHVKPNHFLFLCVFIFQVKKKINTKDLINSFFLLSSPPPSLPCDGGEFTALPSRHSVTHVLLLVVHDGITIN
jgi:hypothetical protein